MLIEERELTPALVDLGNLTEYVTMALFGDAVSHRIVEGAGGTLAQIQDTAGEPLYPGFFMTKLRVPLSRRLERFSLWKKVAIGVDARLFAGMIVDASFVLGAPGEIASDPREWERLELPSMQSGQMFVVESSRTSDAKASVPRAGCISDLPRTTARPDSMVRFSAIRGEGTIDPAFKPTMKSAGPLSYSVIEGRDIVAGHAVMFATFVKILDHGERELLTKHVFPPFPTEIVRGLSVLEREIYYLYNCYGEQELIMNVGATMSLPTSERLKDEAALVGAFLETVTEVYERKTNRLLVVSKSKKAFVVKPEQKVLLRDFERLHRHHGRAEGPP